MKLKGMFYKVLTGSACSFLVVCIQFAVLSAQVVAQPMVAKKWTAQEQVIVDSLKKARQDMQVIAIEQSPIKGMYAVEIKGGSQLYINASGSYFVAGDLFKIGSGGFVNLSESKRDGVRKTRLASLNIEDMIVFAPEKTKAVINVFTDIDCGYCQKLHREVPKMNELGIEVRYLAYPRAGIGSKSYEKIATAWCAKDKKDVLTRLKNRENVKINVCDDNPVAAQFTLGQQIGVRGTPAMVTESGKMLPGYMPADRLAQTLGL